MPVEYIPLTKLALYAFDNLIYPKTIHLCASVFKFFFIEYLPLWESTKLVFSILENVFYPNIIHLLASVFQVIALNNYLCAS